MTLPKTGSRHRTGSSGFTLLEVIVALAITGFVLGSLFSLVAGSKQLAWRSQDSLLRANGLRAVTNFALLQNRFHEVEPILRNPHYRIVSGLELPTPERKTQPTIHTLQGFAVQHRETADTVTGSRWIRLDLPR